jgi:hypothetical protein
VIPLETGQQARKTTTMKKIKSSWFIRKQNTAWIPLSDAQVVQEKDPPILSIPNPWHPTPLRLRDNGVQVLEVLEEIVVWEISKTDGGDLKGWVTVTLRSRTTLEVPAPQ